MCWHGAVCCGKPSPPNNQHGMLDCPTTNSPFRLSPKPHSLPTAACSTAWAQAKAQLLLKRKPSPIHTLQTSMLAATHTHINLHTAGLSRATKTPHLRTRPVHTCTRIQAAAWDTAHSPNTPPVADTHTPPVRCHINLFVEEHARCSCAEVLLGIPGRS